MLAATLLLKKNVVHKPKQFKTIRHVTSWPRKIPECKGRKRELEKLKLLLLKASVPKGEKSACEILYLGVDLQIWCSQAHKPLSHLSPSSVLSSDKEGRPWYQSYQLPVAVPPLKVQVVSAPRTHIFRTASSYRDRYEEATFKEENSKHLCSNEVQKHSDVVYTTNFRRLSLQVYICMSVSFTAMLTTTTLFTTYALHC